MFRRNGMTDEQKITDENDDGRHDFRSATLTAGNDEFVDDEGHKFERGQVSKRDEADEQ